MTNRILKTASCALFVAAFSNCSGGNSTPSAPAFPVFQADASSDETYNLSWSFPSDGGKLVPGKNYIYATTSGYHSPAPTSGVSTETPVVESLDADLPPGHPGPSRLLMNGQIILQSGLDPRRITYSGADSQLDYLSNDGSTVLTSVVSSEHRTIPLSGLMKDSPAEVLAGLPIDAWINFNNFAANAKWKPGAAYITKASSVRKGDTYFAEDCENQKNRSHETDVVPIPCTSYSTLEQSFPISLGMYSQSHVWETDFLDQGTIINQQGFRMWVANQPLPETTENVTAYRIYFELSGNVYAGVFEKDGATILNRMPDGSVIPGGFVWNNAAVASIQAGLITGAAAGSAAGDGHYIADSSDLFGIGGHGPNGSLTPADLKTHYNIPNGLTGKGQTVAVIDAPGTADALDDLNTYSDANGLPRCDGGHPCFTEVDLSHGARPKGSDWGTEISLDTQLVHGIAPDAKIILVTAASNGENDLFAAVNYASALPGVTAVSMSFMYDNTIQTSEDPLFAGFQANQGISFFASSGDDGAADSDWPNYPATSPYVTAVGGTRINSVVWHDPATTEVTWQFGGSGIGYGPSGNLTTPAWQTTVVSLTTVGRQFPDVSAVADFQHSALAIYNRQHWNMMGGTSASAPIWAGITALFGEYLAQKGESLSTLVETTPGGLNGLLYQAKVSQNAFYDISVGTNNLYSDAPGVQSAAKGFDAVTGWGAPNVSGLLSTF